MERLLRNQAAYWPGTVVSSILLLGTLSFCQSLLPAAEPASLKGLKAPDFRLAGTDGQTYRLSTIVEPGPAIVVWFPKAYTGNVEIMLKSIEKSLGDLQGRGLQVLAASCDKTKYLTPFSRELGLSFPILADPTRTTAIQWTVVHDGREIPERWAYFIGRDGRIASVLTEIEAAKAGELLVQESVRLGW